MFEIKMKKRTENTKNYWISQNKNEWYASSAWCSDVWGFYAVSFTILSNEQYVTHSIGISIEPVFSWKHNNHQVSIRNRLSRSSLVSIFVLANKNYKLLS